MANNPLFNQSDNKPKPVVVSGPQINDDSAADLIRDKVAAIYRAEPSAKQELTEANHNLPRSKHQQYMYDLGHSGKDLATIQTEWHNYYTNLPANEQHQVWQEFYDSQDSLTHQTPKLAEPTKPQELADRKHEVVRPKRQRPPIKDRRGAKDIQAAIRQRITAGGQLRAKHNLQSLMFGLAMGCLVVFVFLFGFFNEVIIAPFIQPSRVSASTPIIINSSGVAPTSNPEVIIPKINVEIPVDYTETSTNESVIENDLQDGVVHYPTTVLPGQLGNTAYFGHSSNNIFNQGKYKFAFVLLHTLVNGDTFYLTYNDKIYVYKVINKYIVSPSDVNVLNSVPGQIATATLITCDPPGTSINRLIVVGQQISPNPTGNSAPTIEANVNRPSILPSDGPSAWNRFISTAYGKLITTVVILGGAGLVLVKLDRRFKNRF